VPRGGPGVQLRHELGFAALELAPQQFAAETVVAEPLASIIERDDQHVAVLDLLESKRRTAGIEDRVAERSAHAVEKGRADQERGIAGRQLFEDLGPQVVAQE